VAELEGAKPSCCSSLLGDGLTPSLTVLLICAVAYCVMATPSPGYLFKHVRHATHDIQNNCHQWLSSSLCLVSNITFQWRIQKNFERGRQFISSVLIYRKCAQRNICLLYGKSGFLKKNMSIGGQPHRPLNPPVLRYRSSVYIS